MAAKQRATEKVVKTAEEILHQAQEHAQRDNSAPERHGLGRPPKTPPCLEQATQAVEAAHQVCQRRTQQREKVTQSIRAIGYAYYFVDLERGVRRNGKLIASDIQEQIDTLRTIAQQEALSNTCLERISKAERVVPKTRATVEFVSTYVRQQVKQLDLPQSASYAMHAHLIPSYYLERIASTKTIIEGQPLRELGVASPRQGCIAGCFHGVAEQRGWRLRGINRNNGADLLDAIQEGFEQLAHGRKGLVIKQSSYTLPQHALAAQLHPDRAKQRTAQLLRLVHQECQQHQQDRNTMEERELSGSQRGC